MPVATLNIKYVNAPKPGKKMGSIKGDDGTTIWVWADKLAQFSEGQTVTVEYAEGDNDFKTFVKQRAASGATATHAADQGLTYSIQQAPKSNGHYQQPNPNDQSRHIYITGVVGRAMGSGKYSIADIRTLTREAAQTYDEVFLGKMADDTLPDFA